MNKETEDKIRQQLHELLDIVIDTNGLESRVRRETGTLPTLFFDYNGHINNLKITMNPDGWEPGCWTKEELVDWHMIQPLTEEKMEKIRSRCAYALTAKKESEVLGRDIAAKEIELAEDKKALASMKRKHRKLEKEGR